VVDIDIVVAANAQNPLDAARKSDCVSSRPSYALPNRRQLSF